MRCLSEMCSLLDSCTHLRSFVGDLADSGVSVWFNYHNWIEYKRLSSWLLVVVSNHSSNLLPYNLFNVINTHLTSIITNCCFKTAHHANKTDAINYNAKGSHASLIFCIGHYPKPQWWPLKWSEQNARIHHKQTPQKTFLLRSELKVFSKFPQVRGQFNQFQLY